MKRKARLFALLAMVFVIGACNNTPETPPVSGGDISDLVLNIEATTGDFTRATDTAFETGDAISIFGYRGDNLDSQSLQTWISNGKFTKGANGFSPDQTYYWFNGEDQGHIIGIYPFKADYRAEEFLTNGITFNIKSDQSTHAGYTASDFMQAVATNVTPTNEKVTLQFSHILSKLVVDIDNQTSSTIKEVYVENLFGGITYTLWGESTNSEIKTIKAGKLTTPSSGYTDSYALIVPPQNEIPSIAITTTNDKQYTFGVSEPISFNSGKVRHLKVTITEESISTEIDAVIRDWESDEDVDFSDTNNPGSDTPEHMKMAINLNWELTVFENYYNESNDTTYPAVVQMLTSDDMAYNLRVYTKEFWQNASEEERLLELYNYSALLSETIMDSIAYGGGVAADYLHSGDRLSSLNLSDGEYIVCAMGLNSDGSIAYKYACSNYFTYTNIATEDYLAWCGSWEISDGKNSNIIEITPKEAGRTYWLNGWEGINGMPIVLEFDKTEKCIKFFGQIVAEEIYLEDGTFVSQILLVGRTNYGIYQNVYVVDGYMQDENSAIVESKMYSSAEDPEYFTNLYYVMVIDGQTYYATDPNLAVSFPATMTRITNPAPAEAKASYTPMIEELPTKREFTPKGLAIWGEYKI